VSWHHSSVGGRNATSFWPCHTSPSDDLWSASIRSGLKVRWSGRRSHDPENLGVPSAHPSRFRHP
jgi:hypothetical protein